MGDRKWRFHFGKHRENPINDDNDYKIRQAQFLSVFSSATVSVDAIIDARAGQPQFDALPEALGLVGSSVKVRVILVFGEMAERPHQEQIKQLLTIIRGKTNVEIKVLDQKTS